MESHGGTTYCALAALQLSGQMNLLSSKQLEKIKRWLLFRQDGGFQGRPNKPIDSCWFTHLRFLIESQFLWFSFRLLVLDRLRFEDCGSLWAERLQGERRLHLVVSRHDCGRVSEHLARSEFWINKNLLNIFQAFPNGPEPHLIHSTRTSEFVGWVSCAIPDCRRWCRA